MFRNESVNIHQFSMVPRADIPRSSFVMEKMYKTTFDSGYLVPVFCEEVMPGDTFNVSATMFARLATPLFPIMDNLHLDSFFFFVPYRLVWTNWVKFMGEQTNPGDSISYTIPQQVSPVGGYAINSLQDYLGLPTIGQVNGANSVSHSALPVRACNLIWNEWFRDQNLQTSLTVDKGDGPDATPSTSYVLQRRGKRYDYFTASLVAPQKGVAVSLPLGSLAPVKTQAAEVFTGAGFTMKLRTAAGAVPTGKTLGTYVSGNFSETSTAPSAEGAGMYPSNLYADLSTATAATINQLRQAFQIQRLLERDARGGTRYVEKIQAHYGVRPPDFRLQRPEYLGGGSTPVVVNPIAQTGQTGLTGGTTPLGTLGAQAQVVARHGFSQSFTEHGVVLGFVSVRADLTYQQGLRRFWSRSTMYDFPFPVFMGLGEQAVLNKEIYVRGDANDPLVFGYQERFAECRHSPSEITGLFRSTAAGTIDPWHLAQKFTALPALNATFIADTPPVSRVVAVGSGANGQQFIFDSKFRMRAARPMPMYSVPGLIDHF